MIVLKLNLEETKYEVICFMEKANMKDHLNINFDLIEKMTKIKKNYIEGNVDVETTRKLIRETFKDKKITPLSLPILSRK